MPQRRSEGPGQKGRNNMYKAHVHRLELQCKAFVWGHLQGSKRQCKVCGRGGGCVKMRIPVQSGWGQFITSRNAEANAMRQWDKSQWHTGWLPWPNGRAGRPLAMAW
jgi:hypothetical protein